MIAVDAEPTADDADVEENDELFRDIDRYLDLVETIREQTGHDPEWV